MTLAGERLQTHALDRAATGVVEKFVMFILKVEVNASISQNLDYICSNVHFFCCRIIEVEIITQWKPLIMITLGLALFDNNNRLITLSEGYKNLRYVTQFIVTVQHFTCIQNNKINLKTYVVLPVVCS
jgi:hypothetical protein